MHRCLLPIAKIQNVAADGQLVYAGQASVPLVLFVLFLTPSSSLSLQSAFKVLVAFGVAAAPFSSRLCLSRPFLRKLSLASPGLYRDDLV